MSTSKRLNGDPKPRPSNFPGERLGLPQSGPRSVGRFGRRFGALVIDWVLASLLASGLELAITGVIDSTAQARPAHQALVYGLWVALMVIEVPILGGTLGHRLTGMAVTPLRGGWPGAWRPVVRALLLGLLVPALVWDSDQRGFHDKVAGTVLVRT
jgi:uncharacterized RDD family membrane protein YckC